MRRFLAAIGLTALVLAGNALGGGVTRASSDMTTLDCTVPFKYGNCG